MEKEQFEIAKIIADYLSGKISDKEMIKLHQWIALSESNRELFDRLSDENFRKEKGEKLKSFDIEQAWRNITEQMPHLKQTPAVKTGKSIYFRFTRIAAASVLLIAGLYSIYTYTNRGELKTIDFNSRYEAQLKLSDGRVVDLTAIDGEITLGSGSKRVKNSMDILEYNREENLSKPNLTEYNEVAISFGRGYKVVLSDGTLVHLNSLSKLRFPVNFSADSREVYLEGEAYFEVTKDNLRPFIVKTELLDVKVLGTKFNITSYNDDNLLTTTLVEGSVKISSSKFDEVTLSPNEQLSYNKVSSEVAREIVDVSYYTSWKEGSFRFKDIRLEDLMKIVQRLYNVDVIYSDRDIKEYMIGCNINRYEKIDPVLRIIEANGKLNVKIKGRVITISKK